MFGARFTRIAAIVSVLSFVLPCAALQFMPFQDDEFGVNRWTYFDPYVMPVLLAQAAVGVVAACLAGAKRSAWWYIMVPLNAQLFIACSMGTGGF